MNQMTIYLTYDQKGHSIQVSFDLPNLEPMFECIMLSKLKPATIMGDNFGSLVRFIPIKDSPLNALYQTLHSVFNPMLQKGHKFGVTSKLQSLLTDLESNLETALKKPDGKDGHQNFTLITSISDEYTFWCEQADIKTGIEKERSVFFRDTLKSVKLDFDKLGTMGIYDMIETVEKFHDVVDDMWRQQEYVQYPQDRMCHLLSLSSDWIIGSLQQHLSQYDLLNEPLSKVLEPLKNARQVTDDLLSTLDTLTAKIWPNTLTNKWVGESFKSETLRLFSNRLHNILQLRSSHELLIRLLSLEEQRELQVEKCFSSFNTLNPLVCSSNAQRKWNDAMESYKEDIISIEKIAASKLQRILSSLQSQPSQLLREFHRYKDVIKRQTISRELEAEKEILLGQLIASFTDLSKQFADRMHDTKNLTARNMTQIVANIIWARQMITRISETDAIVNSIFGPKPNYLSLSNNFFDDLRRFEREQFDLWVHDTKTLIDDEHSQLTLEKTGKLMELDFSTGKLNVNYGDHLVTLLREVRQLLSMGLPVPAAIQKVAENGRKYYRHGVTLKQVANFYNTIDQQMLPCQQAMLLGPAIEFERIVKSPTNHKGTGAITWDNPQDLETYVSKLQSAAEDLTSENRKLRKYHSMIVEHIKTLMDIDLVKNQTKWKEVLNSIRQIINSVQESGVKPENTLTWRNHWDYQLYKTLEYQYQLGLESLSEGLTEIKVDLIYKQQKLQLRPPFEEIRAKYYREMKKFINLPTSFKALGDGTIFKMMVDQNSHSLSSVYTKAENLFQNLAKVQDIFKDWVILGSVDLDLFVNEALADVGDWEQNFRLLKQKGKDSEQLPLSIQLDCITVSAAPVKAAIDDQLQKLFDALLNALKKSTNAHIDCINQFTNMAMEVLLQRPQSMAEIGHANTVHEELSKNKIGIQSHFEAAEQKNKLLKSVCGVGVDTTIAKAKWSKLELMLESHELMIKEQVDILRTAIDTRIQTFLNDLEKFSLRWHQLKPKPSDVEKLENIQNHVTFVKEKMAEFVEFEAAEKQIMDDCSHFGVSQPDFPEIALLREDLNNFVEVWCICEEYIAGIERFTKEDWITFRTKSHLLDDYLALWTEKLSSKHPMFSHILKDIDSYRILTPYIKYLRGETWTAEHWGELFRIVSLNNVNLSDLTFGHLMSVKDAVYKNSSAIIDLNNRANGEVSIREAIQELDVWGASASFSLVSYQDAKGENIQIIKEWKETLTQVGDNQSLLQSLKDSPYYKNFVDKASVWEQKLAECEDYLRQLNTIQRKWVYLEPIFSRGALPSEQSRFIRIDEDFRAIMGSIAKDSRITLVPSYPSIKNTLSTLSDQLERCQKALNEFLEQKRMKFARFYFLGDEDLLEILGQSKNPEVIQTHLKKLFAGVHSVVFNEQNTHVTAMKSIHGELVVLKTPVLITDEVESWLNEFSLEMINTLQKLLNECLELSDICKYPSQIVGLSEYLHFTANVEAAIKSGSDFTKLSNNLKLQLEKYTTFDTHSIEDKVEKHLMELKIKSLILDIIHFIDVLDQLKKANVKSIDDWGWSKQLRFYLNNEQRCIIRMYDAEFNYTYEYQGIPPKLVHTPLTDKCYLTLTQAMSSGFGGNPFGPAGTGKTESVKALGVLFGRQVLVFNCDEGIDYKSMGRIFVGLVKCGAWGCFDEFNRLEEAVLSAVSQQIQVIQAALKKKENSVTLLGKSTDLDPNSGIFVTLNPAGKGYGGRQKLPDNLKQLFRSVAMTHPNYDLIAEVILLSEGFLEGKILGSKVVSIFTLSKQFLTPQQHYDWGLRPLKAVLSLAGNLIHEEQKKMNGGKINEALVVVKALCASTISKLTFGDAQKFNLLLKDLFPTVVLEDIAYEALSNAVKEAYAELDLIYLETQAEKIKQLYEACRQRMGVVLVGPSGSGKTTIWKLLERAWVKMGQRLVVHKSNPKAVDRQTLLGHMDIDTREWSDGILTYASRQAVKEPLNCHSWIICDGDVDPEWVESLNSVLDDNRLLTMPNGERIQFGPNVNFIFETHNLSFASPATVSRMGMIYLSDETLDIQVLVQGWLKKRPEKLQILLKDWIQSYLYQSIDWIRKNCETVVETTKAGLLYNALSHVEYASDKRSFLYGLIRGFGANLYLEQRLRYANELLTWGNEPPPDNRKTLDYFINQHGDYEAYQRNDPTNMSINSMQDLDRLPIVETPDLKRTIDIIMPWLKNNYPFLIIGPEGAGKFTTLRHCFSKLKSTNVAVVHCSSQTKSSQVLQRLYQSCVASTTTNGRVLRPKDADKLILYLKDINLPSPDKYDTVELVQFLQQLLTYKGFFDSSLEWISIENIQIVASMNPSTAMGRHKLSTRFTSTIRLCYISYTDHDQLQSIYKIFLQPIIDHCIPSHQIWSLPKNVSRLASTIVNIYEQTVAKFTVDLYSHYNFTPRDISRLVFSLVRYIYTSTDEKELIDIIAYESQRLFQDRLVGADARQKFQSILFSILRSDWNYQGSLSGVIFTKADNSMITSDNISNGTPLIRMAIDAYRVQLQQRLTDYERDVQDLHLKLFPEMLEQITRIERVISQPGGSLLLAGRPGIDYYKLVNFAGYSFGFKVFYPKVSLNYSPKLFLIDLKQALQIAGVNAVDVIFMVEDYQLVDSSFLESLNSLLSGSEVGGIYSAEELDVILSSIKDSYSQEGFRGTLYEYLVSRIRKNLHIVLIFDSASDQFASRCESNPALYTRCQMQWMDSWSPDSMNYLVKSAFSKSEVLQKLEDKEIIGKEMLAIHQNSLESGSTPKHFSLFLAMYNIVYKSKREMMKGKQSYLTGGLKKLKEATQFVDKLSNDAKIQQKELAEKQLQADSALKQITESMVNASEQKKEMEILTEKLKEEEAKMLIRKQAVEKELAEVEPVIRSAKSAVGDIRSEALTEIRSLRAPPPAIRDVLEAVLRLMGNLDMSWNSMKGFLGQRTVKEEIMNFDVRSISKQTRDAVAKLINEKQSSFEESVIKRASVAAAPLALWVKANIQYAIVIEKVAPLEADLKRLTNTLDESKNRVAQLKRALDEVDEKVATLREDFGSKTREAESLRAGLERALEIMHRSQGLLEKLSGEGKRWHSQYQEIDVFLKSLPRNALLSAAFMVYLAGKPEDFRQKTTQKWCQFTNQPDNFDFKKIMSSESEQLIWKSQGLPSDALSNENAIIILNNRSTSLLIDPSGQSTEWLKFYLKDKKPEIVNQSDDNFLRSLELAVRFGKTLIVQEVTQINPILFPLIRKALLKQGPRFVVELGDKQIDYNEEFKLYLVTRRSTFMLPTNVVGFINDVNFTITRAGLAGQLLGVTLKHERPQLEVQKIDLLKKEEELKIQLSALEDQLLKELANAEGNILENKGLITSLNEAKEKSTIIANSLAESKVLQSSLDLEREKYTSISVHGSTMYFVINDLKRLNNMYQFSLSTFLRLFELALATKTNDEDVESRNKLISNSLEKLVFNYISRSILKADRHMLALFTIHELHCNMFEENEWELFSGQVIAASTETDSECPDWVPIDRRSQFKKFQNVLPKLFNTLNFSEKDKWVRWMKEPLCDTCIPRDRLSLFQKLLVIQVLRPDRLLTAMTTFCTQSLGLESLSPPSLNLKSLFESETMASEPILFITTPGADPSQELREFGIATVGLDKYKELAMGQGQGDIAIQLVKEGAMNGDWICLHNIHLVIGWVQKLEKVLVSLKPNANFRLWLTSESHPKFPISLLENCLKITVEAPPGLKKNLRRIYDSWTPEFIGRGNLLRSQALFGLAWFHAVIQERRNYIPQGWNKFYEFSAADLRSSAELLSNILLKGERIQWTIIHGLLKDAIYGGRIDDHQDGLKLETYLTQYFNDDVLPLDGRNATQKLCKSFSIPRSNEHAAYKQIIQELPENDNVVLFGLPANIDRTMQSNTSQEIISKLQLLTRDNVQTLRFNKDQWAQQLLPFLQLWKKLNTGSDILQKKLTIKSNLDPILSFFDLELQNGLELVQKIHNDLGNISKILRGTVLLSNEVQSIGSSLILGETPKIWSSIWEGSEKAQIYIESVILKATSVNKYRDTVIAGSFFSLPFQISNLYNPITYLNALRQQTSRKLQRPMDTLKLISSWRNSTEESSYVYKVTVEGILIQGCNFDGERLSEATPNDPIFNTVPAFQLAWVPEEKVSLHGKMNLPVYVDPSREKLVTNLLVPMNDNATPWILAGVALFLSVE
ncbi:dynein heavy chain and region D6 of dynein motor-domain-containing protein [Globomyces pollinis-pini]|nr:dynein heavy chain and region D6 of dynein motor-domain-containing protein [Globomyces pollinis-pini]